MDERSLTPLRSHLRVLLGEVAVTMADCGAFDGTRVVPLVMAGETLVTLGQRALHRVLAEDLRLRGDHEVLELPVGTLVTPAMAERIDHLAGPGDELRLRGVCGCEAAVGVCAACFGALPTTGALAPVGFALGSWAVDRLRDLGEVQRRHRGFAIGDAARTGTLASPLRATAGGVVSFVDVELASLSDGRAVVLGRQGELVIQGGGERSPADGLHVPYGAKLCVHDGERVEAGAVLASWDDHILPILSPSEAVVQLEDLELGAGLLELRPPGQEPRVIVWAGHAGGLRPRIELLQEGTRAGRIFLPDLAALAVVQGQQVERGSLIASLPRERARAADVPPRRILVEAALQGRAPGPVGLMAEQDGFVSLELLDGWTYRLTITPDGEGEGVCYELPFDAVLRFQHGDFVRAGELISEGSVDPWEVLRIQGEAALVRHVCDTVAECYAYERPEGHVDERAYELAVRAGYLGRSRGVR